MKKKELFRIVSCPTFAFEIDALGGVSTEAVLTYEVRSMESPVNYRLKEKVVGTRLTKQEALALKKLLGE